MFCCTNYREKGKKTRMKTTLVLPAKVSPFKVNLKNSTCLNENISNIKCDQPVLSQSRSLKRFKTFGLCVNSPKSCV